MFMSADNQKKKSLGLISHPSSPPHLTPPHSHSFPWAQSHYVVLRVSDSSLAWPGRKMECWSSSYPFTPKLSFFKWLRLSVHFPLNHRDTPPVRDIAHIWDSLSTLKKRKITTCLGMGRKDWSLKYSNNYGNAGLFSSRFLRSLVVQCYKEAVSVCLLLHISVVQAKSLPCK